MIIDPLHTSSTYVSSSLNQTSICTNSFDIVNYTNKVLSQNEIEEVLNKIWTPDLNYNFPIKSSIVGKQKKVIKFKFKFKWLLNFPWLAYSESNNGAYCKYCVAFAKTEAGINCQKLGVFAVKKYDDWRHALENFKNHSNLGYHQVY